MIHEARIIPIDGRPHLPASVRPWNGDPRGHWEGNTLVVDTTNFNGKGWIATKAAAGRIKGIPQTESLAPRRALHADRRGHDRLPGHDRRPERCSRGPGPSRFRSCGTRVIACTSTRATKETVRSKASFAARGRKNGRNKLIAEIPRDSQRSDRPDVDRNRRGDDHPSRRRGLWTTPTLRVSARIGLFTGRPPRPSSTTPRRGMERR